MDNRGNHLPFSADVWMKVEAMGIDPESLIDTYLEYADKNAAKGKPISDPVAYFLKMAKDEAEKLLGTTIDPTAITSPNEWARGAALARATGTPATRYLPPPPTDDALKRINARLRSADEDPDSVLTEWRQARRDGRTRANFSAFADVKRADKDARPPQSATSSPRSGQPQATKPRRSADDALRLLIAADPKAILAEPLRVDVDGFAKFLASSDAEAALEGMVDHLQQRTVIGTRRGAIANWEQFRPRITEWLAYRASKATTKSGG
jgi:hypothetical protein